MVSIALIDDVYEQVKIYIESDFKRVTATNVSRLIVYTMVIAKQQQLLSGRDKKMLVMHVMAKIAEETEDENIILAVQLLGPGIIDTIVDTAKGRHSVINNSCCCLIV